MAPIDVYNANGAYTDTIDGEKVYHAVMDLPLPDGVVHRTAVELHSLDNGGGVILPEHPAFEDDILSLEVGHSRFDVNNNRYVGISPFKK